MKGSKSTTNMVVTSIRLEEDLKQALKNMNHSAGYQFLIREVLWDYVRRNSTEYKSGFSTNNIVGIMQGISTKETTCVISQKLIAKGEKCVFGISDTGAMIPVHSTVSLIAE